MDRESAKSSKTRSNSEPANENELRHPKNKA